VGQFIGKTNFYCARRGEGGGGAINSQIKGVILNLKKEKVEIKLILRGNQPLEISKRKKKSAP